MSNKKANFHKAVKGLNAGKLSIGGIVLIAVIFMALHFFGIIGNTGEQKELLGTLTVHAVDVGQGDCYVLVSPNGKTMLIDSGESSEADTVIDFLNDKAISTLDIVVASHPHSDHMGSMAEVLETFDVGLLLMPKLERDTAFYRKLMEVTTEKNIDCEYVWSGDIISWDEQCTVTVLGPVEEARSEYSEDEINDWSIIMNVAYQQTSILFTGDATKHSEQLSMFYNDAALFDVDVLKVGHHGSTTSSTTGFLEAVSPEYAVISVGKDNSYGHPDFDTVNRLNLMGVQILRTDELGCITITMDGRNISIDHERGR